jgi:ADP-ribose pyrophosphatase YjhB (NUDIX family)
MHEIERHILKKFIYNESLQYNAIWDKVCESNKFNYHLKRMVTDGYLKKSDDHYLLTSEGRHYISTLDGKSIATVPTPIVGVFVLGLDTNTGKVLMHMRTKQPFMHYLGIPGGKLDFGSATAEKAAEEFFEETGLSGKLELGSIVNYITIDTDENKPTHHMVGFNFLATELSGDFIEKTREGENLYIDPEKIEEYSCYPDIPYCVRDLLAFHKGKDKQPVYREAVRTMKDNKFSGVRFL